MDLHHIHAFLAVAEELHFGRAATRLHITQPPLTRTIKQLERELDSVLFKRSTRSVELTAAGEALVQPAHDILAAYRLAEQAVRSAGKGNVGRVRLGFAGPSSHLWIADLSQYVRQHFPGISLELQSTTYADHGSQFVLDGTLDLAIARWSVGLTGLESRVIDQEHYVLAVPEGHPFAERESVSIAECRDEQFITLPAESRSRVREAFFQLAHEAEFAPRIAQTAQDSWTMMALVGAGVGINFTVDSIFNGGGYPRVRKVKLKEGIEPAHVRLFWREDDDSPALRTVLEAVKQLLPADKSAELDESDLAG